MSYVITCGDEGVQINEGTRLAFAGAGVHLEGFQDVVPLLQKALGDVEDNTIVMAASDENSWIKNEFQLDTWEQASATMQQQVEALADQVGLAYAGVLPFADPEELKHGIKGHMVRPKGIHIATKIAFTCAGGEQTYHLGQYQISADWVSLADASLVEQVIKPQVEHYRQLANNEELPLEFELEGPLGEDQAAANKAVIESLAL